MTAPARLTRMAAPSAGRATTTAIVVALGAAAAAELLVLRIASRLAIHVPLAGALATPYEAATFAGRFAFHFGAVSLVALLLLLARRGLNARDASGVLVVVGSLGFIAGALMLRAGFDVPPLASAMLLAATASAGLGAVAHRWVLVWCVAPLCLSAWVSGMYVYLQDSGADLAMVSWLPLLPEGGVIFAALATPVVFAVRRDRTNVAAAVALCVFVVLAFVASPATTRILLLWSEGLPGRLPSLAYGVAAGAYLVTIVDLARRREADAAVALSLLLAGGVAFQNTYQTGLVVVAMALLASMSTNPAKGVRRAPASRTEVAPTLA